MNKPNTLSKYSLPFLVHQSGKRIPLENHLIIGRVQGHIIIKNDSQLSSEHARFDFDAGNAFVTDLNSSNGISINNHVISPGVKIVIPNKAEIKIGSQIFTLDFPEAEIGSFDDITSIAPLKLIHANGAIQSPPIKKLTKPIQKNIRKVFIKVQNKRKISIFKWILQKLKINK